MVVLSRASWFQNEFEEVFVMSTTKKFNLEFKIVCQRNKVAVVVPLPGILVLVR